MQNTNNLPNYTTTVEKFYTDTEAAQLHIVLKISGMLTDGTLIGYMEIKSPLPKIYGWGSPHVVLIKEFTNGWHWKRLTLGRVLDWTPFL